MDRSSEEEGKSKQSVLHNAAAVVLSAAIAVECLAQRLREAGVGTPISARLDAIEMDYDNWPFVLADADAHNHIGAKVKCLQEAKVYAGAPARVRVDGDKVYALDRVELIAAMKAGISDVMVVMEDVDPLDAPIRACQIHGGLAMGNKAKAKIIRWILPKRAKEVHGTTSWLDRTPGWLAAETGIAQQTIVAVAERSNLKFSNSLVGRDGRKWSHKEAVDKVAPVTVLDDEPKVVPQGDPTTVWARVRWPILPPEDYVRVTIQKMLDKRTGRKFARLSYDRTVGEVSGSEVQAKEGTWRLVEDGLKATLGDGVLHIESDGGSVAGLVAEPSASAADALPSEDAEHEKVASASASHADEGADPDLDEDEHSAGPEAVKSYDPTGSESAS